MGGKENKTNSRQRATRDALWARCRSVARAWGLVIRTDPAVLLPFFTAAGGEAQRPRIAKPVRLRPKLLPAAERHSVLRRAALASLDVALTSDRVRTPAFVGPSPPALRTRAFSWRPFYRRSGLSSQPIRLGKTDTPPCVTQDMPREQSDWSGSSLHLQP